MLLWLPEQGPQASDTDQTSHYPAAEESLGKHSVTRCQTEHLDFRSYAERYLPVIFSLPREGDIMYDTIAQYLLGT